MTSVIFSPLDLPNGNRLANRVAKAAMEENMAEPGHLPGPALFELYKRWAQGGSGLLITGNVMIDARAMTGPGGIALEADTPIQAFAQWAGAAKQNNTQVWMQINHPGRQVYQAMGGKALAPSNIALDLGKHSAMFAQPKAMLEDEIQDVIARFVTTAQKAVQAGFDGVQIHAAHGYLISQFLSPLSNKRDDEWGGSLANRARLLEQVVVAVRKAVPAKFAVAVKLNSADFQRGGFSADDAAFVVQRLGDLAVDLVELSGGSYESPAMQGDAADGSTLAREAYFLEFAKDIAKQAAMPIMTTGGIKRLSVAEQVLQQKVDLVGMGTALAFEPDLPEQWRKDSNAAANPAAVTWKDSSMAGLARMAIVKRQLQRMGQGKKPKLKNSPLWSLLMDRLRLNKLTKQYKAKYQNA